MQQMIKWKEFEYKNNEEEKKNKIEDYIYENINI